MSEFRTSAVGFVGLFTSLSTLLCCALPALFVALGAGAVLAGIVSRVPQLIWLSEHKIALFAVAGLLLVATGILRWRGRNAPCPIDPAQAYACRSLRRWSGWVYGVSVGIYAVGFFFAFLAVKLIS